MTPVARDLTWLLAATGLLLIVAMAPTARWRAHRDRETVQARRRRAGARRRPTAPADQRRALADAQALAQIRSWAVDPHRGTTPQAVLEAMLAHAPVGVYVRDLEGRFLAANDRMASILGQPGARLVGRRAVDVLPSSTAHALRAIDDRALAEGAFELDPAAAALTRASDPGHRWWAFPVDGDDGRALGVGAMVFDIGDRGAAAPTSRAEVDWCRGAFNGAVIAMAVLDPDHTLVQVNDAFCELLGYSRTRLEGTSALLLGHPEEAATSRAIVAGLLTGERTRYDIERRYLTATGTEISCAMHATLLRDASGIATGTLVQLRDTSERRRYEHELRLLADHDPLTGLYNRRAFLQLLGVHGDRVSRYGYEGSVLMIGVDQFKSVNDTLGHQAGDELLVGVARLLRDRLRASDIVARLDGDTFAVLLPKATSSDAEEVATALLYVMRTHALTIAGHERIVHASIGVASFEDQREVTADAIMVNADCAMNEAKEQGRNQVRRFTADHGQSGACMLRGGWTQRIVRALASDSARLDAQPIVDLATGETVQHELLLRLHDERGRLIKPDALMRVAEQSDLVCDIDRWVATQAIAMLAAHPDTCLAMNLSGRSMGDPMILKLIRGELRNAQIDPARLVIELTETAALADVETAQAFARSLAGLGCRFSLDDFGVGYGDFYYLKHLKFDFIKIDGEFVRHCTDDPCDRLMVSTVVDLARGFGTSTIAECIEDQATLELMRTLGIDCGQGYGIARPAPLQAPGRPPAPTRLRLTKAIPDPRRRRVA